MTEQRKEELRQLLYEAMEDLEIRPRLAHRFPLPPMDVHTYKAYLRKHWTSYSSDSLSVMNYVPHTSKSTKLTLLDFIRKEFAPFIREDRILSASSYFLIASFKKGYPLTNLLVQLLKIAIVRGIEEAVLAFDEGTKDTHGSAQSIALLEGIKIKTEIPIFEGIRLVRLPNSTWELPPYSRNLYIHPSDTSAGSFLGKTLLIIDYSVFPIFHTPFDPTTTIQEYRKLLNRTFRVEINGDKSADSYVADFSEEFFCQALSLACNSAVQAALKWRFLADDEIFNLNYGTGGSIRISGLFGDSVEAGQSEIDKAKCLYHNLINLNSKIQGKLQIAIDRWIKSKTNQTPEDKIIDLAIAFEALYLPDMSESTFKFAVRASWHLGEDRRERVELFEVFKELYKYRSRIVHGGERKENVMIEGESVPIKKLIMRAQDLCRDSIEKIIKQCSREGKFPKNDYWDSLILG